MTIAKYLTPNGCDINKHGIDPDVKVELNAEKRKDLSQNNDKIATPDDSQFRKAIKVLNGEVLPNQSPPQPCKEVTRDESPSQPKLAPDDLCLPIPGSVNDNIKVIVRECLEHFFTLVPTQLGESWVTKHSGELKQLLPRNTEINIERKVLTDADGLKYVIWKGSAELEISAIRVRSAEGWRQKDWIDSIYTANNIVMAIEYHQKEGAWTVKMEGASSYTKPQQSDLPKD